MADESPLDDSDSSHPELRTVDTVIRTRGDDRHLQDSVVTAEPKDPAETASNPAAINLVVWLDIAHSQTDSMTETLELVLDQWIEHYCTHICGGHHTEQVATFLHNVENQDHLRRLLRGTAIGSIGTATTDVDDEYAEMLSEFLFEVYSCVDPAMDSENEIELVPNEAFGVVTGETFSAIRENCLAESRDGYFQEKEQYNQSSLEELENRVMSAIESVHDTSDRSDDGSREQIRNPGPGDRSRGSTRKADDDDEGQRFEDPADTAGESNEEDECLDTLNSNVDETKLDEQLAELQWELTWEGVDLGLTKEILDSVRASVRNQNCDHLKSSNDNVREVLREALYEEFGIGELDFGEQIAEADKPIVIVFLGVKGVNKTSTIHKLSQYLEDCGFSSVRAIGDTDPTAVIHDAVEYAENNDIDVVLGDTAGRLQYGDVLKDQLETIDHVIHPDLALVVDEATQCREVVRRSREFDDAVDIDGTILTKADEVPELETAIPIAYVTGKPIWFMGTGQDNEDLTRFPIEETIDRLLGSKDRSSVADRIKERESNADLRDGFEEEVREKFQKFLDK